MNITVTIDLAELADLELESISADGTVRVDICDVQAGAVDIVLSGDDVDVLRTAIRSLNK